MAVDEYVLRLKDKAVRHWQKAGGDFDLATELALNDKTLLLLERSDVCGYINKLRECYAQR